MERKTNSFRAVSDGGEEFIVIEYRRFARDRDLSGTSTRQGLPVFRLSDGSPVNRIDPETYKIVQTDQIIRKI